MSTRKESRLTYKRSKIYARMLMLVGRGTLLTMSATLESIEWYCKTRINAFLLSNSVVMVQEDNGNPRMAEMKVALLEFWRKR